MNIEINITYDPEEYIEEQCFIINNEQVSICNYLNGWGDLKEYETKDARTLLKQILASLKNGTNFKEFGIPQKVKIFNLNKY